MKKAEIVQEMLNRRYLLKKGANELSKIFKVKKDLIYKAKEEIKEFLHKVETTELSNIISDQEDEIVKYLGSDSTKTSSIQKFESSKPLSPKEIETLVGVDNISTYVNKVLDRQLANGKWIYTVDVRFKVTDFYSEEDLKSKLKDIFTQNTPIRNKKNLIYSDKCLNIILSDDHCGAINETGLFSEPGDRGKIQNPYSVKLKRLFDEIINLNQEFDEINIISLGDQLNGFNKQTTRGGHEVNSLSNKDQFDIYVKARKEFYDLLFSSEISQLYNIFEVNNSNHSGNGFSYMANSALELYIDSKFNNVVFRNIQDLIDGYEYGRHLFLFTHGKDDKFQKKPMPLNLDAKTDLWVYDWLSNKNYNPKEYFVTLYKGDLHSYNIQLGKFGRYCNIPSIAGNSDYSDINFGPSKPGAILEVVHKMENKISTTPIWF